MKSNPVIPIVIFAFVFRMVLLLIDTFWFRLPQGGADTESFDRWAYNVVINGHFDISQIFSNGTLLFTTYGSLLYEIFGRNPFVWAFTMLLLGVGTVYNVYKTVELATKNKKFASFAGWMVCLYPNIAILSVLVLRESPIHFFISLAALNLVKYITYKKLSNIILFFFSTLMCTILHSGMFAVFVGFVVAIVFNNKKMKTGSKVFIIGLTFIGLFIINSTGIGLSKFGGSFEGALDKLEEGVGVTDSGATYPSWLILQGGVSDLWKIPLRMIAFLFAPLIPFFVRTISHVAGIIDSAFYIFLFYNIYKKRLLLKQYPFFGMIFSIIFLLTFAFSLGSSNFGTNIRHRAKLLPLIIIVGSVAYKVKISKNNSTSST